MAGIPQSTNELSAARERKEHERNLSLRSLRSFAANFGFRDEE
jgi:hypothetical protein